MSGSGADIGFDYQADAIAYISAHGLSGQPLPWFEDHSDVPVSWLAETGGPGDDIRVITAAGPPIEVQAKHGLKRGEEYDSTLVKLVGGLQSDSHLRAVLLVDRHASEIIRDDLKRDVLRLGQGRSDGIKRITEELLIELRKHGLMDVSVLARLRISVVDLDNGSDGVSAAQSLLSRVVAPTDSATAFRLLGKRGHELIKNRGQDDVNKCARFLERAVGLAPTRNSPAISCVRFAAWVRSSNEAFYSPALQKSFPIRQAWSEVILMDQPGEKESAAGLAGLESQIRRYQEWARLTNDRTSAGTLPAEAFLDSQRLSVIVGGPGSGKTPLSKKLAFFAAEDQLAIRVRLATVAAILRGGGTFESALAEAATDSSGWSNTDGKQILAAADLLIADGLDECDPRRADVAIGLSQWAASHPKTKLCVMTRPVGHSPALLPGFCHADLLPLGRSDIRQIAGRMISALIADSKTASSTTSRFIDVLGKDDASNVASIAARNPLLLSFLVRLFIDGQPIDGRRMKLFDRIIDLIWKSPPLDRKCFEGNPDRATAWAAAEVVGWSSIDRPDRPLLEIYRLIAERLGGGIEAERRAEVAVRQWIDHGLMEQLSAGSLDTVVFVSLALGEYLAGRYLAQMPAELFAQEIERTRRKARWREPILHAAGVGAAEQVVQELLAFDSPNDPESSEACLAATALAEVDSGVLAEGTVRGLAERLKVRLCSPVPAIAIDAGEGLATIAHLIPEFVASLAVEFWEHHQPWTRLASICAGLCADSASIPIQKVVNWIEEFETRPAFLKTVEGGASSWGEIEFYSLYRAALPKAFGRIAKELPISTAKGIIDKFLAQSSLAMGLVQAIQDGLTEQPGHDLVTRSISQQVYSKVSAQSLRFDYEQAAKIERAAYLNILGCILVVCSRDRDASVTCLEFRTIGDLFSSMGYWESTPRDIAAAGRIQSDPMLIEVLRGMIVGLRLDPEKLAKEANGWLNHLSNSEDRLWPSRAASREPDPNSVRGARMDSGLLADALQHPSWFVASNAASLFEACGSTIHHQELLGQVLSQAQGTALLLVGSLAESIWTDRAFKILADRLAKDLTAGCGYLYKFMVKVARTADESALAVSTILDGVAQGDPKTAELAATALCAADSKGLVSQADRTRLLFDEWRRKPSWCQKCNRAVANRTCDSCSVTPPCPEKPLVSVLARTRALSVPDLLCLASAKNSGIREEARKAMVSLALDDAPAMNALISAINAGKDSGGLLNELLKQAPDQLRQVSGQILELVHSRFADVRKRVITSLSSGWIDARTARDLALQAIGDESPPVRSAAAELLKRQAQA